MSTRNNKRKLPRPTVALEISRSSLSLVVIEHKGDGRREIRGHQLDWLQESNSLCSEDGVRELTAGLTTLVAKEKLAGAAVHVALSSEFCVTRVAAGETEKVLSELRALGERTNQYLLLGPGEKAIARSLRPIDAKQSLGWLTVTNQRTLDNVVQAFTQAGLHVELIEHAMVAMCRAVGETRRDTESPVIIVDLNQRGVDLGISYRGQLLFDYRPGGMNCKGQIAEIVARHLQRIQRYCNRHFGFAAGRISQVFVCGDPEEVEQVRQQFSSVPELAAEALNPRAVVADGDYNDAFAGNYRLVAPLGSALITKEDIERPASERGIADLMDFFRSARREPLVPTLIRLAWPMAAVVLLSVGVASLTFLEYRKIASLERQQQQLNADRDRVVRMRMQTADAQTKVRHLQRINSRVLNPAWHDLMTLIGRCRPEPVWLEAIRVEQDGTVTIVGPSYTQDAIFDFIRYLEAIPLLSNVNLQSQTDITFNRRPAIRFDIQCRYNNRNDRTERTSSDDN